MNCFYLYYDIGFFYLNWIITINSNLNIIIPFIEDIYTYINSSIVILCSQVSLPLRLAESDT